MTTSEKLPVKPDATASQDGRSLGISISTLTTVGLFVAILVIGGLTAPGFLTIANAKSIMIPSAFVGIIAVGMTIIMLSGRLFSMSLGTTAAIGGFAFFYGLQLGLVPAIIITLLLTGFIGWVQGAIIGTLDANPIIVTIAAGVLMEGAALAVTKGTTLLPPSGNTAYTFLNSRPGGIPVCFLVFVGLVIVLEVVLRRTRFGRDVYAVGENVRAARSAAISIPRVTAASFAVASACAGVAGILLASQNQNVTLTIEGTRNFDAIAAVLVGGSLVTGGKGSALRSLFGAIVIATLGSLLLLRGYSSGVQILIKGVIVLAVVCIVHVGDKRSPR